MTGSVAHSSSYQSTVQGLLEMAGISINGSEASDPVIHNDKFYKRVLAEGSLGLGESYMEGWWDCEALDTFFDKLLRAHIETYEPRNWYTILTVLKARFFNPQSLNGARKNATHHYDIGNDFFETMLDERMTYTCGYWKAARDLDEAQEAKLDLTCRKLKLEPGMRVLDIGCGWGSFVKYAAENYGVQATGINISEEQIKYAREDCKDLPVTFKFQDYRNLNERFDRIVSLGMFEHVGHKNFKPFFEVAHRCLKDDGIFLLHTIGGNTSVTSNDEWLTKYIFPHSLIPSIKQIAEAMEGLFVLEDLHNFGVYYDHTLLAWYQNFIKNWDRFKERYGNTFFRMWRYYLLCCAGSFRARKNQLWQLVLSKNGLEGGYKAIR